MAGEFFVDKIGLFDNVTLDADGNIETLTPLSPLTPGGVLNKWLVCVVRGQPGSYPIAIKLDAPGASAINPGGSVTIEPDKINVLVNNITLHGIAAGTWKFTLYLGDASLGTVKVEV